MCSISGQNPSIILYVHAGGGAGQRIAGFIVSESTEGMIDQGKFGTG